MVYDPGIRFIVFTVIVLDVGTTEFPIFSSVHVACFVQREIDLMTGEYICS